MEHGNPHDAPQLAPAVERITTRAGRPPGTVTADRGYGEKRVEDDLHDLGVRTVAIPRKGRPSQARAPKNNGHRSDEQSSGAPAAKAASAPSNETTVGTAPASTAPKEPGSGPGTASSPTTSSRSAASQHDPAPRARSSAPPTVRRHSPTNDSLSRRHFFRSK